MNDRRYAGDKPADCGFCYFWNKRKGACSQGECYYLRSEDRTVEDTMTEGGCGGCPYGKHSPCIGYCLRKIIREMKLRV